MNIAALLKLAPWIGCGVLALGLAWSIDAQIDQGVKLKAADETVLGLRADVETAQKLAANLSIAATIQAESAERFGASLATIDARLSSGLEAIAHAPDSTHCAGSAALRASERILREQAAANPARP